MNSFANSEMKYVKNKNQSQDLSFINMSQYQQRDKQIFEVNSPAENKGLLQHKEYQNWFRKRYRVRANINYLWYAHQLYDKEQLDQLFQTVVQNQPEIYKYDMKLDEQSGQPTEINLEAFYHVMKKLGKDNFMDRDSFNNIMHMVDRDGNKKLNKNEFYTMLMSRTINQFFQDLNLQSWKKSHQQNNKENIKAKRHRFASADSQQKFNKKYEAINNKPQIPTCFPSILTSQNKQNQRLIDKNNKSSSNTPIQELDSNLQSPNMKDNQSINLKQESKDIENFSQIDITKMIGKLKYENDRTKLMQDFQDVRKDKSVDIQNKCDKLNQIINQKYFNIDNIGVSPTQKLLSKNRIEQIRKKSHSPSQIVQFGNNQSAIDQSEGSIFFSDVNGLDGNGSAYQSTNVLTSIYQNCDKNNQFSIDNSTNLSSNFINSSIHQTNSTKIISPNSLRKKFQLIEQLSEANIEQYIDDKIQDPLDQQNDKYYNINHHILKKKSNTYSARRNYFQKDTLLSTSPFNQKSEINQNYEVSEISDRKNMILQSQTINISQPNIIFDDSDDDEDEQINQRELGMIVERAKYKGRKQAEILSNEQVNKENTQVISKKRIDNQKLREISNTTDIQNQQSRNMKNSQKQRSLSQQKRQNDNKREIENYNQIQNLIIKQNQTNYVQKCYWV